MVAPVRASSIARSLAMIEFAVTAHGLYFRFHLAPETLVLMLILARMVQRFL